MSGSDGLMDFGTGLFSGASTGAKIAGTPGAIVGGLGLGALSYFGGAKDRRNEDKNNRLAFESMEQDNTLGRLSIVDARQKVKAGREQAKRKELFGTMLAQYFQRQGGK